MKIVKSVVRTIAEAALRDLNYYLGRPCGILIFLTYRCSSRCNTCNMWQRKDAGQELTLAELKNFVDMARGRGANYAEMFGGDALLRKDVLIPLVAYIKKRGIPQVSLTTNCNLMDETTAKELVEAGLDVAYVSVDGVGEIHDRVRGVSGSFERTKKGIEYLISARGESKAPQVILNCTISNLNIDKFEEVLLFAETVRADTVAFECAGEFRPEIVIKSGINGLQPNPHFLNQGKSLLLNETQARSLKEKIKMIKARKNKIKVYTKNIDILALENLTLGIFPNKKCYVCRCRITLDPYGNILPCSFFDNYIFGNIRERHFSKIWNNGKHRDFLARAARRDIAMCNHCIVGVARNSTFLEWLKKGYFAFTGRGLDQN